MKNKYAGPLVACVASVLFATLPIIVTLVASSIASANGCRLNEGSPHPCVVAGTDIGDTLYAMGLSFWFRMATLPLGALGLLVSLIWLVRRALAREGSPTGL